MSLPDACLPFYALFKGHLILLSLEVSWQRNTQCKPIIIQGQRRERHLNVWMVIVTGEFPGQWTIE